MVIPVLIAAALGGGGYLLWRRLQGPPAYFVAPSGTVNDTAWSLGGLFVWETPAQSYMTAALPGTVVAVDAARTDQGRTVQEQSRVTVQHPDGSRLRYVGETASVQVRVGQRVRASDPIMRHIRTQQGHFMGGLTAFDPGEVHVEDPRPWLALRGARLFA